MSVSVPGDRPPRRLTRPAGGRLVAGVAVGLAGHLRLPTWLVRVLFVVTAGMAGFGLVLYAVFWTVVPQADADGGAGARRPSRPEIGQLVGFVVVGVLLLTLLSRIGLAGNTGMLLPLALVGAGVALVWRQADEAQRRRWSALPSRMDWSAVHGGGWLGMARVLLGVVLVAVGVGTYLTISGRIPVTGSGLVAAAAVIAGVALVTGPWWWRLYSDLTAERRARIRSEERADIAAHVHDSVLHTLALIQRSSDSPREVVRLARGQERELRRWLYESTSDPQATFAGAMRTAAAEVEDAYSIGIETVVVGDAALDEGLSAIVQAAREALVNAGRHAGVEQVSLYAEVEADAVNIFVRDRGKGFDVDAVDRDRHGIAGSIRDRMSRHGGSAQVLSAPGEGTEVRLRMSRLGSTASEPASEPAGRTKGGAP